MEFPRKIFVLTKTFAEHQSDIAYLCRICLTYSLIKVVIYDSLWEN